MPTDLIIKKPTQLCVVFTSGIKINFLIDPVFFSDFPRDVLIKLLGMV